MSQAIKLAMNMDELVIYMGQVFPQVTKDFAIDALSNDSITMRLLTDERHLRPGGTVSGPSMFMLADVCVYAMILARIGRKALAVTTNCSIDFMRKPVAGSDLIAHCKLLKLGRQLAVGDVAMYSQGSDAMVARATLTYSIPPQAWDGL